MPTDLNRATQRFLRWALLLYVAFVSYGSLVPLNFHAMPLDEAWSRYQGASWLDFSVPSRTDWAVNFLLLIPMAFLAQALCSSGSRRRPGRWLGTALLVALGCALFAGSIEFTQLFFPGRTMSPSDVEAQILGSWLGLAVHAIWGRSSTQWLVAWWQPERDHDLTVHVLRAYLIGLLLFAVMPLDLTISPVELWRKWRDGRVALLPFTDLPTSWSGALYEVLSDAALWLPVGALWRWQGRSLWPVVLRGLVAAASIEVAQLLVLSRHSSTTDIFTGALGCGLGAQMALWFGRQTLPQSGRTSTLWLALWPVWAVLTLAAFWFPFDFAFTAAQRDGSWTGLHRMPFQSYFESTELRALTEILRKLMMFLPGGVLWSVQVLGAPPWRRRGWLWAGRFGLAGLAFLVEAGHFWLPGRVSDGTDMALETAGGWIGLALGLRLFDRDRRAAAPPAASVSERSDDAAALVAAVKPTRPTSSAAPVPGRPVPILLDGAAIVALAAALVLAGTSPMAPPVVRGMFPPGAEALMTGLALALACWSLLALPIWLLRWWRSRPERALWLVPGLPLLGAVGVLPLLTVLPRESLARIVGSPVLGWPEPIEPMLRCMALYGAAALALYGATWSVALAAWPRSHELLGRWWVLLACRAGPLHWLIVEAAAGNVLTQLMRAGGSPFASACLFAGALLLFAAGCALSAALAARRRRSLLLALIPLGLAGSGVLLWLGSEPLVIQDGRAFSAAQLLLSSDRQHYARGAALLLRFIVAELGLVLVVCLMQVTGWWRLAQQVRTGRAEDGHATLRTSPETSLQ